MKDHIVPYFEATEITLGELRASHIQSFYLHELETLKATSVLRFHANLHKALKYAVKLDLIPGNPVDKVEPVSYTHLDVYKRQIIDNRREITEKEIKSMYPLIFSDYPDIVTVRDLQKMLGISRHAVYDLLAEGELGGIRLGNAYRIPKLNVVRYVLTKSAGRPNGHLE